MDSHKIFGDHKLRRLNGRGYFLDFINLFEMKSEMYKDIWMICRKHLHFKIFKKINYMWKNVKLLMCRNLKLILVFWIFSSLIYNGLWPNMISIWFEIWRQIWWVICWASIPPREAGGSTNYPSNLPWTFRY